MSRNIKAVDKVKLSENQRDIHKVGKLLFTRYQQQECALLISDNRLRAAQFFPLKKSEIGAVYIAKVKNLVKNLKAYFVEIGGEEKQTCFLSQKDAAHPYLLNRPWDGRILEGDEFPVQVTRDAKGNKQASVTTLISLSNAWFALSVGNPHTGYSAKLGTEQKRSLQDILEKRLPMSLGLPTDFPVPVGIVVRTRAAEFLQTDRGEELLLEALEQLTQEFAALFSTAAHRTCFSCLKSAPPFWEDAVEHLVSPGEYEEILTDDTELYDSLKSADCVPEGKKIRLYSGKEQAELPLSKLYGLDSKLEAALKRRVWLKSGGYLFIEPTEALTVIDVNSGKYESSKTPEETYELINREAAEEIALQLRLRNLSGIIIVDFINMKSKEAQEGLVRYLTMLTAGDRQRTTVVDITPLGLVEITRKKVNKPLAEQFEGQETY